LVKGFLAAAPENSIAVDPGVKYRLPDFPPEQSPRSREQPWTRIFQFNHQGTKGTKKGPYIRDYRGYEHSERSGNFQPAFCFQIALKL
jgi:hypothetical protein